MGPIIGNEGCAALVPEPQLPLETTTSATGVATRAEGQSNLMTNGSLRSEVDWVFPGMEGFNDMLESSAGWLSQGLKVNLV
jgi:hypothetical protein